ncbi:MAG: aceF [Gammaproteobacteria bacterium]|jgi:pyruvate dehydrogenase E2 component (dihydrolipoamide acetyltransferase)|nr:aceF [Gammaproteobacteria bacterium]
MSNKTTVTIPDIGGANNVDVIEVFVKAGDTIQKEDSILTLESDKASMEIPSPISGVIEKVHVKVGDKVSEGHLILTVETSEAAEKPAKPASSEKAPTAEAPKETLKPAAVPPKAHAEEKPSGQSDTLYAGPAVRKLARELGVDLMQVRGSGQRGRIMTEDVTQYVKKALSQKQSGGGLGFNLPALASVDFSKFGEIKTAPLNRIKKLSGSFLHRNWLTVPHITQFADADITELENFRKSQKDKADAQGIKLTPIVFVMKAVVAALKAFPQFNASLDETGENLILKQYYHIGVAVDTPNGLMVPVIRDVDKKGIYELAAELGDISKKAREKGLTPLDMQGGCFSISSLGGIGGTAFTPIVNLPEVAILGLSKSSMKPVYHNGDFTARLILPLSLSYDHRVIDGADGARFVTYLADGLADLRLALL